MIRNASPDDAKAIAKVHVDSWKSTYAGVLPQASLDDLGYRGREAIWKGLDPESTFVAEQEGVIVGFVSVGAERSQDPVFGGELYAIYILESWQRRGIGRELFLRGVRALVERGFDAMLLWVLRDNPARSFYEAMGGSYLRSQSITIFGAELQEDAFGWTELRGLLNQ